MKTETETEEMGLVSENLKISKKLRRLQALLPKHPHQYCDSQGCDEGCETGRCSGLFRFRAEQVEKIDAYCVMAKLPLYSELETNRSNGKILKRKDFDAIIIHLAEIVEE